MPEDYMTEETLFSAPHHILNLPDEGSLLDTQYLKLRKLQRMIEELQETSPVRLTEIAERFHNAPLEECIAVAVDDLVLIATNQKESTKVCLAAVEALQVVAQLSDGALWVVYNKLKEINSANHEPQIYTAINDFLQACEGKDKPVRGPSKSRITTNVYWA